MGKAAKFLVVIGGLIGIGAAVLFAGSQAITSDIIIQEGQIDGINKIEIEVDLDPEINSEGVFVVQTMEGIEISLSVMILDPYENKIITNSVVTNSFEGYFDITEAGIHTLVIETTDETQVNVVGGIGHVPDALAYSISMIGFAMLLIGMIGVIIVGIILIRQRKQNRVS
tara:strand:+ start:524 stop:1033 length:510 start_codon:yes stop_codon:yes gene_type:complete